MYAEINGTPTISDWYDLQIISNLYSHGVITVIVGGVPLTLPVNVNYFDIVGHYDTVSRYMITVNQLSTLENINNNLEIRKISLKTIIYKLKYNLIFQKIPIEYY